MIKLYSKDIKDNNRHSSKGNQLKWNPDNRWFKADYTGYEGFSEYMVSRLLSCSSLSNDEYTDYATEEIEYKSQVFKGCVSYDFAGDYHTITLERLFNTIYGGSLTRNIFSIDGVDERLTYLVEQIIRITGLKDFGIYLAKLLTLDAIFLNEDRHLHNISILVNDSNQYKLCPIYDNGAALLSDTTLDYPMNRDIYELIDTVKSKTLSDNFDEQLDAVERMYGHTVTFTFGYNEVNEIASEDNVYDESIKTRVIDIIMERRRKYRYLFNA